MRAYILTDHEKQMLIKYVETGEKSYGFDQLRKRIKDDYSMLKNYIELIETVLKIWEKG